MRSLTHPRPLVLLLAFTLSGCVGPLIMPAVHRLAPDEQAQVNQMWDNMLAPPDRLPRDVLLDTIITFNLHQIGVDRLTMRSEKGYAGGTAVMLVNFDRLNPAADSFAIELYDRAGLKVRTERYSSDEVVERAHRLWHVPSTQPVEEEGQPTTIPGSATRPAARTDIGEALMQRVVAATQPAAK